MIAKISGSKRFIVLQRRYYEIPCMLRETRVFNAFYWLPILHAGSEKSLWKMSSSSAEKSNLTWGKVHSRESPGRSRYRKEYPVGIEQQDLGCIRDFCSSMIKDPKASQHRFFRKYKQTSEWKNIFFNIALKKSKKYSYKPIVLELVSFN